MTIKPIHSILITLALIALITTNQHWSFITNVIQWALVGYVGIFGLITWLFLRKMTQAKSGKVWINQFLASIAIKMFMTLAYLTIFLYVNKNWDKMQKLQLAFGAFIIYIIFTLLLASNKPKAE